jgi:hypothetical protein
MFTPKKFIICICSLLAAGFLCATEKSPASVDVYSGGDIEIATMGRGVSGLHPTWGDEDRRSKTLCFYMQGKAEEWQEMTFSVVAKEAGWVSINLRGPVQKMGDGNVYSFIYYDNIVVNGAPLQDGDFEGGQLPGSNNEVEPSAYVCEDPGIVRFGKKAGVAWLKSSLKLPSLQCEAGEKVSFSVWFRAGGAVEIPSDMYPLDFRSDANMGFHDEVALDGRGGWSDQGPEKDFANFDSRRKEFGGIVFDLIDAEKNSGKSILTFDSPNAKTGLKTARLIPQKTETRGRFLYLLHASAWTPLDGEIGEILVRYKDKREQRIEVVAGLDLVDWQNLSGTPNGKIVYSRTLPCVGSLTLSSFELFEDGSPSEIVLTGSGKSVWMVVGATVASKAILLAQPNFVPDAAWKPADFPQWEVPVDSPLDMSSFNDAPAGKYGRVVTNGENFEFKDRPGQAVRFLSFQGHVLSQLFDKWKSALSPEEVKLAKERAVLFTKAMARQGYNAHRDMEYMTILTNGADEDSTFRPEKLDIHDFFNAEARKNGIYWLLCIGSERMGFTNYHQSWQQRPGRKLSLLLGDPEWKERWEKCARNILNHHNPYTGVAVKDDPSLIGVELFNEQTMEIFRTAGLRSYPEPYLVLMRTSWRSFLTNRYDGDISRLNKEWQSTFTDFAEIDVPISPADSPADWNRFINTRILEFQEWGIKTLREIGYAGPISNLNMQSTIDMAAIRAQGVDFTTYNTYFAHPFPNAKGQNTVMQNSAIQSGLWHITALSDVKLRGRPMFVTEYNIGMPNAYGHENGLTMPAFAAFQGYGGLSSHEAAVRIESGFWREKNISAFNVAMSPINRANEFMTALFFRRGDVARSPKEISYFVTREAREDKGLGKFLLSRPMLRLSLIVGAGMEIGDNPKAKNFPPLPKADAVFFPSGYSDLHVSEFFVKVSEGEDKGFDLADAVEGLRKQGIIPKENQTDIPNGVYQSITGEFLMRLNGTAKVVTPRSEAASLMRGGQEHLNVMDVSGTSVAASVGLFSMDEKPLKDSDRMILIYSTEMIPEGMELSPNRNIVLTKGNQTPLLLTGTLSASLALPAGRDYELHALSVNGVRREEIPMSYKDGRWLINIDTATLENGPTVFFELRTAAKSQ